MSEVRVAMLSVVAGMFLVAFGALIPALLAFLAAIVLLRPSAGGGT